MTRGLHRLFALVLGCSVLLGLVGCASRGVHGGRDSAEPPPLPREFRGVWIATVANIDWPSQRGLPVAALRAEMQRAIDTVERLKLNAIILQVRPAADAIYPSALEPWSEYLSGEQGRAPAPGYDPLAEWIAAAHARGIELHAWFNPFRARHSSAKSPPAATHVSRIMPDAVKRYGDMLWIDPGDDAAARHSLNVIADVVRRYDVDGVHVDDYFYPYPVPAASVPATPAPVSAVPVPNAPVAPSAAGTPAESAAPRDEPFPDEPSWLRYQGSGGRMSREDWRRENVSRFVAALYREVHAIKPGLKVGISPFGVGRPDRRPPGISGFSQYDRIYADVERWLANGWLDYLAPQLYWPIAQTAQAFPVLLDYWTQSNVRGRHIWPGLFTSRIDASEKSWSPDEITQQIATQRSRVGATGHLHFSLAALNENRRGVSDVLARGSYATRAWVPATPWRVPPRVLPPQAPLLALQCGDSAPGASCRIAVAINVSDERERASIKSGALWLGYGDASEPVQRVPWTAPEPLLTALPRTTIERTVPAFDGRGQPLRRVAASWLDRHGREGPRSVVTR
ncbi:MAG: family 10 glycosylhydrolase [Burkholderiales bacterium]|nr:family 10 glycosylhydrolase [Burkholderiales bacterium]